MSRADPAVVDEAAAWVTRTRDPAFRDWDAFTGWLEGDPSRNRAYEAALDAHDAAGLLARAPPPVAALAAVPDRFRRRWLAAAAAAALGALVGAPLLLLGGHDRYTVSTGPGEQRAVRLADGTTIALNGDSRLTLDRAAPRRARLDTGEAAFTVVHDDAHPFVVDAGSVSIRDVGTVFNVVRGRDATDVAVAEGAVVYDPAGAGVKLTAGRTLHDPDSGLIEIGDAPDEAIGAWRHGRLVYSGAPLAAVAADLARATGERIGVAADVAERSFTGTIELRGADRAALPGRLASLAGVAASRGPEGWLLEAGRVAAR